VVGETEPNATAAITAVDNLTVGNVTSEYSDTVASGLVISQNPTAGTYVPIGTSIDLVISLGQPQVPDVVGMTEPNAATEITGVDNLTVGNVTHDYSDTMAVGYVISQDPGAGTFVSIGSNVDLVLSLGPAATVPDVGGMTEADANSAITSANLAVGAVTHEFSDTVTAGEIISQNPLAGTTVPAGSSVDLVVSLGTAFTVPNVVGMTDTEANSTITAAGLVTNMTSGYSDTVAVDYVISQNPAGGTDVTAGATVTIVVSLGKPEVPDVVGQPAAAAIATIEGIDNLVAAATYRHDNNVPSGTIISQNPVGGTVVNVGSTVNIAVSLGRPTVPGVVGLSEAEAVATIEAIDNLTAVVNYEHSNTITSGTVMSQDPVGGTNVDIGTTVTIMVSLGEPMVPDVVGMVEAAARTAIEAVDNLMVAPIYVYDNNTPFGIVMSQYPAGGTLVDVGTTVNMVVSLGQPEVPGVVGMFQADANAAITAVDNLTVGTITKEYNNTVLADRVISQSPTGGTKVMIGSTVDLVVSLGKPKVPDVVGMTEPNATVAITAVDNLAVGSVTNEYSDTVATDLVISQNPPAGTEVLIGSTVDFAISLGQPEVPYVVGMTRVDANVAITAVDEWMPTWPLLLLIISPSVLWSMKTTTLYRRDL
jgi:beta-lactam-binding protein with PASTA domain